MSLPSKLGVDITYDDIRSTISSLEKSMSDPTVNKRITGEIEAQKKYEATVLIPKHQACPAGIDPDVVASRLPNLNAKALKEDVSSKFYDSSMMIAAACVASSSFFEFREGALATNEKLKTFVDGLSGLERGKEYIGTKLRVMGAPSVYGVAMSGVLGDGKSTDAESAFVLKAPKSPNDADELIHECCVAFYGTNRMRDIGVPNFAYIYGAFVCSPPYINPDNNKVVETFCNSSNGGVSYAIYENIAPAVSIGDYSETCEAKDFMYTYIQLMLAISVANREIDFSHNDCHGDNVLLRSYPVDEFYVPFPTKEGSTVYCKSFGKVPTLIDFGMSHIKIVKEDGTTGHLGHVGASAPLSQYSVFRDRSFPLCDAYKLYLMCLKRMTLPIGEKYINGSTLSVLTKPLEYFNKMATKTDSNGVIEAINILEEQSRSYYILPYDQTTVRINKPEWELFLQKYAANYTPGSSESIDVSQAPTIDDWIDYCRLFCIDQGWEDPVTKTPETGVHILGCQGSCIMPRPEDKADIVRGELSRVGLGDSTIKATSVLEFYDSDSLIIDRIFRESNLLDNMGKQSEYHAISKARRMSKDSREKYHQYIAASKANNTYNKNDRWAINLYNEYVVNNSRFVMMGVETNENLRIYVSKSMALDKLNEDRTHMYKSFSLIFDDVLSKESTRLNVLAKNISSFNIVELPSYELLTDMKVLERMKSFTTKAAKYFDSTQRINLSIRAMGKLLAYSRYFLNDKQVKNLQALHDKYHDTIDNMKLFTEDLKNVLIRDVGRIANPRGTDVQRLQMIKRKVFTPDKYNTATGKMDKNPFSKCQWYFTSYLGVASFFRKKE